MYLEQHWDCTNFYLSLHTFLYADVKDVILLCVNYKHEAGGFTRLSEKRKQLDLSRLWVDFFACVGFFFSRTFRNVFTDKNSEMFNTWCSASDLRPCVSQLKLGWKWSQIQLNEKKRRQTSGICSCAAVGVCWSCFFLQTWSLFC